MATSSELRKLLSGSGGREQVADLNVASPLRPVSRPTDAYYQVKPETVQLEFFQSEGGGEFADLAKSVGLATPVMQQALAEEDKFLREEQVKAGITARLKNQKSFKEAQDAGLIRQSENPWFIKGYLQQDGRISGMNYDAALRTAWMSSEARNSDNPQTLDKFIGDFRNQWIKDNDGKTPDWMDGFAPKMAQADNNLSAQHVAYRQSIIEAAARENTGIEIRKLLDIQSALEADPVTGAFDPQAGRDATAKQIQLLTADFVKKGLDGKVVNGLIADQIITKGIELQDPDYARSMLAQIKTPGGSVGNITDIAHKIAIAESTIRDKVWSERMHLEHTEDRPFQVAQRDFGMQQIEHTKEQWAKAKISDDRTERVRAKTNEMTMKVLAGRAITEQEYLSLAKDDASAAAWVKNFRHTMLTQNAEIITDQRAVASMMLQLAADPDSITAKDIFGGVASGKWNFGTAKTIWDERQQMLTQDPAAKDPYFASLNHGLVAALTADVTNVSGSAQLDASNASVEFRKYYAELQKDTSISPSDRMAKIRAKQLDLMKHYNEIGLMRSKAAQDAGVAPKSTIRTPGAQKQEGPLPIPPAAIQYLQDNPSAAGDFEKKYNLPSGSASRYLEPLRGVPQEPR
jgi:hypothetical protein